MFLPFQKQTTTTFEPTRDAIIRSKCVLFYGKRNTAFSHKMHYYFFLKRYSHVTPCVIKKGLTYLHRIGKILEILRGR